ncbi:MAG: cold shock domain-containing protein [Bacteroidota bacterium]|jgi:ribosomal protein S1
MTKDKIYKGNVIFFLKEKGFGAIECEELGSVYLHYSKLAEGYKFPRTGDEVFFDATLSERKKNVYEALNVHFIFNKNLDLIIKAQENKLPLKATVVNINQGGLLLKIFNIDAFMPKSEVDTYEFNSHKFLLNKVIDVLVLEVQERSIIASRKAYIEIVDRDSFKSEESI